MVTPPVKEIVGFRIRKTRWGPKTTDVVESSVRSSERPDVVRHDRIAVTARAAGEPVIPHAEGTVFGDQTAFARQ